MVLDVIKSVHAALQYAHQKDFLRSSDALWESSKGVP